MATIRARRRSPLLRPKTRTDTQTPMKLKSMMTALTALALMASPVRASDTKTEAIKAGGAVATGAAAGGVTFAAVGSGGLAIGGTAVAVGAAPFVAIGAVVGLAGYGIYRIFKH